ncbi:MAG: trigger factor, partial [Planctomycetota bacterium]
GELNAELGAEGREVDLGDDGLLEAFKTGLIGMKPGDSKAIEVTFPDDGREDVAGKPAVFEVELKELKERLLPDLDDDFAADVGEFETLDELKADIRERLEKEVATRDESKLREKLIDGLVAINDIPVPPSMVKEQSQQMLYELYQFAQMMGQQLQPGMLEGLEGRAERRVKAGIVLGALARIEKIELEADAVEKKLASIAEETGKHIAKVRVEYAGERLQQLENQLLEEKIVAFLKSRATIDETPEEESNDDGAAKDESE